MSGARPMPAVVAALMLILLALAAPARGAVGARAALVDAPGGARVEVSVTGATASAVRVRVAGRVIALRTAGARRWRSAVLSGAALARVRAAAGRRLAVIVVIRGRTRTVGAPLRVALVPPRPPAPAP
ncbi:MAG: hypothetical protein MUE51_15265, partial [Thermoleophilia bacterium]|nr:hypothetical protein [Thermoleophilia bacterium]